MSTLIIERGTKKDIDLLIDIADKLGIRLFRSVDKVAKQKSDKDKAILELSKKVNKSLHKKFVQPIIDDSNNK